MATNCSNMDFKGKIVIVTGSSSGIGAAAAEYFAKLSANVVIVGRNEDKLKSVAKVVEDAKNIKPLVIKADVTKDSELKKIVEETIKKFGKIDVLVNNAGAGTIASLKDGIEKFDDMIATNLRSVYLLTSLAAPYLIKTKGNIVNVSSVAAVRPLPEFLPYCVAKAGLDMFTKCVAKDLAQHGIRVNSVNPGPVKTGFATAIGLSEERADALLKDRAEKSPLGRISSMEDVADLIVYLASERARSITGVIHIIDCGALLA